MPGQTHNAINLQDFHAYQHAKHQLDNSILKTLHTCYFEYFSRAYQHPSKMTTSIYRKL